ncbi:MAG TPA: cytochrome C oxidase subunit IV family protein [Candidatus Binatia bacterium]
MSHEAEVSVRTYVMVFLALMGLTVVTVLVAHVDLGDGNIVVALAVAITKAALVVAYFMHLRYGQNMSRAALFAGIVAVFILIAISLDDVMTRTTKTFQPFYGALDGRRPPGAPVPPPPPME